jgi:K+-sensing histidine kinase KdpD
MGAELPVAAQLHSAATDPALVRRWVTPITVSAALLVLTTAVLWMAETRLKQDHLIFIYFVPTALIAIRYGSVSAMGVAIAGAFAGAFLLYPPRFSFAVDSPLDLMELIMFSLLSLLASQVVSGFANDREVARRRPRSLPLRKRLRWNSGAARRVPRAASPDQNV